MLSILCGKYSSYWMMCLRKWYLVLNKRQVVYMDLIFSGGLILWIVTVISIRFTRQLPLCALYWVKTETHTERCTWKGVVFGVKIDIGYINFKKLLWYLSWAYIYVCIILYRMLDFINQHLFLVLVMSICVWLW